MDYYDITSRSRIRGSISIKGLEESIIKGSFIIGASIVVGSLISPELKKQIIKTLKKNKH